MVRWIFCYSGDPIPAVVWLKDGEQVTSSRRDPRVTLTWDASHEHCLLLISDAKLDDAGAYTIRAINDKAVVTCVTTVTVTMPNKDEFTNGCHSSYDNVDDAELDKINAGSRRRGASESDIESEASYYTDVTSDMTIDISADEDHDDVLPTFEDLPLPSTEPVVGSASDLEISIPVGIEHGSRSDEASEGGEKYKGQGHLEGDVLHKAAPHFDLKPNAQCVKEGEGVRLQCKVTGQ